MLEVADILRQHGHTYLQQFQAAMLPSHIHAIKDIINCRTPALGGHVYECDHCGEQIYSYHSCKNRSCPKCHTQQTQQWLSNRQQELLPVSYFHITLTIPEQLRDLFRSHQKVCYHILMNAASQAIQELAADPHYCGGTVAILAVLHTWTRQLIYHPHVHCLVSAGGLTPDGEQWIDSREHYLFPARALSKLFRGKCLQALYQACEQPIPSTPEKWVVHCKHWGKGETAVLEYLARYVFRCAITNYRILSQNNHEVRFRYKDRKAKKWRICQLSAQEFIRRFLQHVLPKGFHKVRYYGLWHPAKRKQVQRVKLLLMEQMPVHPNSAVQNDGNTSEGDDSKKQLALLASGSVCPHCKTGHLILIKTLTRRKYVEP